MAIARVAFLVAMLVVWPYEAMAWGSDGHRIVGEIAFRQLDENAQREVIRVLPNHGQYRTLYEGATWADTYARSRSEYDYLKPQHYINADPSAEKVDVQERCGDKGCVVSAIRENACQLRKGGQTEDLRVALYLLAHFVGDIHQPLHVAHPDGRGGNRTSPRFLGTRTKLHKIWDTSLIDYHLQEYESWTDDEWESDFDDTASWDVYAGELASTLPSEAQAWRQQLDAEM